ncbi:DNA topoisomerase I, partial [candidate division WWE3 bacterium CG10_big_fil_rev_8_21_14_0_10_35_32]
MKNLVVVESPSKTKKLASFLGDQYTVVSSVGHIRDLPKSGLGVDVENKFEPEYVISSDKKDVVTDLKKQAKTSDAIYLATDLDREGEAIAWHVAHTINGDKDLKITETNLNYDIADKIKNKEGQSPKVYRVTFNSITKEAVLGAFEKPRKLDMNLINAQQGRRILDRLVGYRLSPLLWEKIRYGLSAGRVQSVAVRLVAEREMEIQKFEKNPYYEIKGEFSDKEKFIAPLVLIDGKSIYTRKKFDLFAGSYTTSLTSIDSEVSANKIKSDLESGSFIVSNVESKESKSHPSPPFTTSTLQQSAASNLGYAPKRTMQLAQKLYEAGYITYMRTDSTQITPDAVSDVRNFIKKSYPKEYILVHERFFKSKEKLKTQEAHEAIRPTDVKLESDDLPKSLTEQHKKLYDLIWRRTVATQMSSAVFANTKIFVEDSSHKYVFEAKGSVVIFDGYLKVYYNKKKDEILPALKVGQSIDLSKLLVELKEMSPPPRYNESSLVKELESFNIGRPSTYASIISTIQARGYVGKNERALFPTDNGLVVNDLLVKHFPQIVDIDFTAEMEEGLDTVALGELDWRKLIKDFYIPFDKLVALKKKEIKKEDIVVMEETDEMCPECKKNKLIIKLGKFGKFLSCSDYPT